MNKDPTKKASPLFSWQLINHVFVTHTSLFSSKNKEGVFSIWVF